MNYMSIWTLFDSELYVILNYISFCVIYNFEFYVLLSYMSTEIYVIISFWVTCHWVLQDEYETIESIYKEEKKQLSELEEKFTSLQKEYFVIIDEREMARRMREESERKMIVMVRAATTIQAFWRSFKVRKVLKAKKKKTASGSEKKKKKKK